MATVIAVNENGQAEIYVRKNNDTLSQIRNIQEKCPEAAVSNNSPNFLTVGFKSVAFARQAKAKLA